MATSSLVSPFQVLPWNGYKAALSLTFDDGNPIHVDYVVPELSKRGLRATFYVIANRLPHPEKWMGILGSGQEIGNHSLEHKHAKELTPVEEHRQVNEAKNKLEDLFGLPIQSFAYPYTEITPSLRSEVLSRHFLARGGNRSGCYMAPDTEPDWADIPSQVALTQMSLENYQEWINENIVKKSWTVLQFHGIEGDLVGWQPLPRETFLRVLDYAAGKESEIWIAPFSEVGAYWRAQKILERAAFRQEGSKTIFVWDKPNPFPGKVVLKIKLEKGYQVSQYGKALSPDPREIYHVAFDAKEITLQA